MLLLPEDLCPPHPGSGFSVERLEVMPVLP